MERVTHEFDVKHATIVFSNGEEENVSYTQLHSEPDVIELNDIDSTEDSWEAYVNRNDEPHLLMNTQREEAKLISTDNFQQIKINWVEELIAVADVTVEEVDRKKRFIFSDIIEYEANVENLEIWDRIEWESKQKDD